jgi:hypothetical protein
VLVLFKPSVACLISVEEAEFLSASDIQWRTKMVNLKLLSAALLATAVIAAPAMARVHHVRSHYVTSGAYAAAGAPYAAFAGPVYVNGYSCVPAPRVGAFATAPWENEVACEPPYVSPRGYY